MKRLENSGSFLISLSRYSDDQDSAGSAPTPLGLEHPKCAPIVVSRSGFRESDDDFVLPYLSAQRQFCFAAFALNAWGYKDNQGRYNKLHIHRQNIDSE